MLLSHLGTTVARRDIKNNSNFAVDKIQSQHNPPKSPKPVNLSGNNIVNAVKRSSVLLILRLNPSYT